jgi:transcriptional regulator with XRE-family HTH domain
MPTKLKVVRSLMGLSQTEFAKLLGISQTEVSFAERGWLGSGTLKRLKTALGIENVAELFLEASPEDLAACDEAAEQTEAARAPYLRAALAKVLPEALQVLPEAAPGLVPSTMDLATAIRERCLRLAREKARG